MNIDQIQSILGAEIECGVFESVVVPALDVCRKVAASIAATVSDAARVALTDERIIDIWCNTPTTRFGGEVEDQEIIDFARVLLDASQAATTAGAQDLAPNQIQVTHTIATADNAATILHALLDSFVEVSAGFPQAKIDDRLANQVRIYLPPLTRAQDERAAFRDTLRDALKSYRRANPSRYLNDDQVDASDSEFVSDLMNHVPIIAAARAASSATAPLTSDSDAPTEYDPRDPGNWRDGDDAMGNYRAQSTNGEQS